MRVTMYACDHCGYWSQEPFAIGRRSKHSLANSYAEALWDLDASPPPGEQTSFMEEEADFCSGACLGEYLENIAAATHLQLVAQALGDMWRYSHPDPVKARRALKSARGQVEPDSEVDEILALVEEASATP